MENKMDSRLFKTFIISILIASLFFSCGAPGAKKTAGGDNYIEVLSGIRTLTEDLPAEVNKTEARRYLARVQKALEPVVSGSNNNGLTIVPVNVRLVEPEYIAQKVQYLGDVSGNPSIVVYPKLTDIIIEISVENGDFVNKGDLLGRIDDATVRSSVAQAEAAYYSAKSQLANVQVEYERMKTLFEANALSRSQWDQIVTQREVARSGLNQAAAALDMARTQLSYAEITAPISGYVSNLDYEPGDLSAPQKPFATIHQTQTIKVAINVTEYDLGYISRGQRAEIRVSTYPNDTFEGQVTSVSPVIDPMTRTARIEIVAPNADMRLKPGMFARIDIITKENDSALTIYKVSASKQTVLKSMGDNLRNDMVVETYSCFIVRDGIALEVPIEVGLESKTKYEVTWGLEPGDLVVVMGQNNLSDSTLVTIVE
jgi:RND family efflux transporter MFP subunit